MISTPTVHPSAPAPVAGHRPPARNYGLDAIRAAAISLVILAHYIRPVPVAGLLGVELFFVLSGFLIGEILYRTLQAQERVGSGDLGRFWRRRWTRTLPNYYLFLCLNVALVSLAGGTVGAGTIWRYALFLQNLRGPMPEFYSVSWSLAVEEWFYLLLPLAFFALYLAAGRRAATRRPIFLGCVVFFAAFSLGLRLATSHDADWLSTMRRVVVYRFDSLMLGVVLAVVRLESPVWWERLMRVWPAGLVLLVVGTVIGHRSLLSGSAPAIPAAWLLTMVPLGSALILPRASRLQPPAVWWSAIVTSVSKWSYSIYLCHLPILLLLLDALHDGNRGPVGKVLVRTAAVAATLVCSAGLYRFFEKPILDRTPRDRFAPPPA